MKNKDDQNCPKTETCPLFQGKILESEKAKDIFIKFFCTAGESGRMECKRYLLAIDGYKPDISILPNDPRSVEELKKILSNN
jgi:hypothetical protein